MIVFPDDWDKQKSTCKKKRKNEAVTPSEEDGSNSSSTAVTDSLMIPTPLPEVPEMAYDIMKTIHNTKPTPVLPAELDLDVILSHVQFSDILSNLFQHEKIDSSTSLPIVTKAYEESFMREPYADEKPCVSGSLCECNFIDPKHPFTAVEFIPPGDTVKETAQLCVLCSRKITQKLFYDILFTGKECKSCIQRYGNICNTPGEYARECVLACPTHAPLHCMPFPIMSHQRNKYQVYVSNGIRCIRQLRVSYEDFCSPLTKE
jgi:hypothetical protein